MTKSSLQIYINENFRSGTANGKNLENPQTQSKIGMFNLETFRPQTENESSDGRGEINGNRFENQVTKNKKTFTIQIDDETEFELRKFKQQLEKERKERMDWNSILKELVKRQLESKASLKEKMVGPKKQMQEKQSAEQKTKRVDKQSPPVSRYIPTKIKHDIEDKYKGKCAYRGCNKPSEQIHHNNRFAINKNHENIVPLCKKHHDFVHHDFAHQAETNQISLQSAQKRIDRIDRIVNRFKTESFVTNGI